MDDVPNLDGNRLEYCSACASGKARKANISKEPMEHATVPMELIHTDLCGPMEVASLGGSYYKATMVDDYSRFGRSTYLKKKSDADVAVMDFIKWGET